MNVAALGGAAAVTVRRRRRPEASPAEAPRDGGPAPAPFPPRCPLRGSHLLLAAQAERSTSYSSYSYTSIGTARCCDSSLPARFAFLAPVQSKSPKQADKCDAGRKRESESESWRAVGVHKSEKQAWGGAAGVEWPLAGSPQTSVATARALALALVPQRRVGVAIVMMWDAAEGKGAFRCCLLLRLRLRRGLPHWLWAVAGRALSLPRVSVCAARARHWGRGQPAGLPSGSSG